VGRGGRVRSEQERGTKPTKGVQNTHLFSQVSLCLENLGFIMESLGAGVGEQGKVVDEGNLLLLIIIPPLRVLVGLQRGAPVVLVSLGGVVVHHNHALLATLLIRVWLIYGIWLVSQDHVVFRHIKNVSWLRTGGFTFNSVGLLWKAKLIEGNDFSSLVPSKNAMAQKHEN
jgi:hypothetical protein